MTDPKPQTRWYQFSLRTLLVLVTLAAIGLSWLGVQMHQASEQRTAVEAILDAGGRIDYDYQFDVDGSPMPRAKLPAPMWLRMLLGEDVFRTVVRVDLGNTTWGDADLEFVKVLCELEQISLYRTQVTDIGLEKLTGLTELESLYVSGTQVTDAGLEHLGGLDKLRNLNLHGVDLSDNGLEHFKRLTKLRSLYLSGTGVTDAGLEHLTTLTRLEVLDIRSTPVTDEGVERLQEALPNCDIVY